jgi:mannose-6-phosphate isomerase-like protein (cupin superfamily)
MSTTDADVFGSLQNFALEKTPPVWRGVDGSESWTVRGRNFVVSYTEVCDSVRLEVDDCPDEYVVLLLGPPISAVVSASGQPDEPVHEESVVVVPPGRSAASLTGPCTVIRLFSAPGGRFLDAVNESYYQGSDPRIPTYRRWADPVGGYRTRIYPLSAARPATGQFGRIYSSSTVMVNVFEEHLGPRDPDRLSPHSHADFEQCTITVAGEYVHHCRTPWTAKSSQWRPDEHHESPSPSITIIPAGVIHTSQAVGAGRHELIDVFAPPRHDFADSGWVRNAEDYRPTRE